jgi:hypothetical protein
MINVIYPSLHRDVALFKPTKNIYFTVSDYKLTILRLRMESQVPLAATVNSTTVVVR